MRKHSTECQRTQIESFIEIGMSQKWIADPTFRGKDKGRLFLTLRSVKTVDFYLIFRILI